MILQALHELYSRLEKDDAYQIAPRGYSVQKITFKVVLHPDGRLFAIQDARHDRGGRLFPRLTRVPGTNKPSGSGLNPGFLWDNTGYMLGFKAADEKAERTRQSFEEFRTKHLGLEAAISAPAFSAVCRFLEGWAPASAVEHSALVEATTGFGVFQILGQDSFVHDDPAIRAWWDSQAASECDGATGQCLVTGETGPIANTHPKIRGIESTGAVLVGFNEPAYESYGKGQSHNAPVTVEAAERYTGALNALLDGPAREKHRLSIGGTVVVFWTDKPTIVEDIFAKFAMQGSYQAPDEVQDEAVIRKLESFVKALRSGRAAYDGLADDPERTHFYLLGLGPNKARLSVRFFHMDTVAGFTDRQRRHFEDIAIERRFSDRQSWSEPEFPSISILLDQTCPVAGGKPDRDRIPPILAGPMLEAVVAGRPYPQLLYTSVLRRLHAERDVTYLKACIIKGYLNRNRGKEVSMSLDVQRKDPAYRVGRLFAALEKTQTDALGQGLNATIRDRFYGSASATPSAVFPRLLRTYQHHLAKLDGGIKVNREKLVQEILAELDQFPAHLDLDDQGLFAIGYYHQMLAFYSPRATANADAAQD